MTIISKVVEQLRRKPYALQREVLYFTRNLKASAPVGVPKALLITETGVMNDINHFSS